MGYENIRFPEGSVFFVTVCAGMSSKRKVDKYIDGYYRTVSPDDFWSPTVFYCLRNGSWSGLYGRSSVCLFPVLILKSAYCFMYLK